MAAPSFFPPIGPTKRYTVNQRKLCGLATAALIYSAGAPTEEGMVEATWTACRPDIATYCSQVTPGEGRLLACFYAHEDKLSPGCSHALYRAAAALAQAVTAFEDVASACEIDIANICVDVTPGAEDVLDCLLGHTECIRDECSKALSDIGLQPPAAGASVEM